MKIGIIGLPGSGKSTVFRALTGGIESRDSKGSSTPGLGAVKVKDERLDFLADAFSPKKITPVTVEYQDIAGITGEGKPGREIGDRVLSHIRPLDAIVHCVRFFDSPVLGEAQPLKDWRLVEEEMIISDLSIVEKRLERVESDIAKGRKEFAQERDLLIQAKEILEAEKPLRFFEPASTSDVLKGFSFLSSKPELVLINSGDERSTEEISALVQEIQGSSTAPFTSVDWLYADSEAEISRLNEDDAKEFLQELNLQEGAKDRIVRTSFHLLRLIVFFTAGDPEVRAWPLKEGLSASKAAGTVHSDMEKGFIRAEVIHFDEFEKAGSVKDAQKAGAYRLEGKDYIVKDGDIILFRFNV